MSTFTRSALLVVAGAVAGSTISFGGMSLASSQTPAVVASDRTYSVSIDEVRQNFVFAKEFSGAYSHTVTMSDGSTREVTLRPVVKDGLELVELTDSSPQGPGITYMGPNGTTTNGTLMVSVKDVAGMRADLGFK